MFLVLQSHAVSIGFVHSYLLKTVGFAGYTWCYLHFPWVTLQAPRIEVTHYKPVASRRTKKNVCSLISAVPK